MGLAVLAGPAFGPGEKISSSGHQESRGGFATSSHVQTIRGIAPRLKNMPFRKYYVQRHSDMMVKSRLYGNFSPLLAIWISLSSGLRTDWDVWAVNFSSAMVLFSTRRDVHVRSSQPADYSSNYNRTYARAPSLRIALAVDVDLNLTAFGFMASFGRAGESVMDLGFTDAFGRAGDEFVLDTSISFETQ
ncbi:hypothetical protein BDZ89DRAFT_1167995 [Hymenopellis radicata]|nr:hypothetical protein BDZ89DRAFT_1151534 [Hymenopellis radicata]KAF9009326.1 hypothetical protein BDZ89DRAFT_1167995 [Hymenopellis radicata]